MGTFDVGMVGAGYVVLPTAACPTHVGNRVTPMDATAGGVAPADFGRVPIRILKTGAMGAFNALGLARATGARFLLASTSEVYGDPLVHPQREDYLGNVNPVGVRGVYDEAKRYAEAATMAYHRHRGVDTRIARIFNAFGPRTRPDDGRIVPNLVRQALRVRRSPSTVTGARRGASSTWTTSWRGWCDS